MVLNEVWKALFDSRSFCAFFMTYDMWFFKSFQFIQQVLTIVLIYRVSVAALQEWMPEYIWNQNNWKIVILLSKLFHSFSCYQKKPNLNSFTPLNIWAVQNSHRGASKKSQFLGGLVLRDTQFWPDDQNILLKPSTNKFFKKKGFRKLFFIARFPD